MWRTHFVASFVPKSKHIQVPEATSLRDACRDFSLRGFTCTRKHLGTSKQRRQESEHLRIRGLSLPAAESSWETGCPASHTQRPTLTPGVGGRWKTESTGNPASFQEGGCQSWPMMKSTVTRSLIQASPLARGCQCLAASHRASKGDSDLSFLPGVQIGKAWIRCTS